VPPATLSFVSDWPSNDAHSWTEELQGITHDAANWYLVSRMHLMRFALTDDLHNNPNLWLPNPWPTTWAHMGAPTFARQMVYVPLESNGGTATRAAFGLFDTNLQPLGTVTVPAPTSTIPDEQSGGDACPWMAYNPKDGLFYSSGFNPSWLYAYDIQVNPVRATFVKAVRILDTVGYLQTLTRIQGGVFSDTGRLYLVSDDSTGSILTVDPVTGKVLGSTYVEHHPGFPEYEELQGLTIFDGDTAAAPGIVGQVHVMLLDNDLGDDDWYLKHYRVSGVL
jgi:hypothetical protein